MLSNHFSWSKETLEDKFYMEQVNELYKKGIELLKGGKLYGYTINVNNPKEVIAALFLIAEDYNRFHERF